MDIKICDECSLDLSKRSSYFRVERISFAPTLSEDLNPKEFCTSRCLLEYIQSAKVL